MSEPIWTLEARDSVLLELFSAYFQVADPAMRRLIKGYHQELIAQLASRGISYLDLKNALIPRAQRCDFAFVFDTRTIKTSAYGADVGVVILKALERTSTCSILSGDLIHSNQDRAFEALQASLRLAREIEFVNSSQFYCIFINNLSSQAASTLGDAFRSYPPYVGYIDATFSSYSRDWLSTTLTADYVKCGSRFISGHEPDAPDNANYNMHWFPLEEHSYVPLSVNGDLFDLFLSYKIERRVIKGFEGDTRFSLNSISDRPQTLEGFRVSIEKRKLEYLRAAKYGSLNIAGFDTLSAAAIEERLTDKLHSNYIYNLQDLEEHDVSKFNVMIEITNPETGRPYKMLVALEYKAGINKLRLLTFF